MKHLQFLHEEFIQSANRSMQLGKLPVTVKQSEVPLIAVERWRKEGTPKSLVKLFSFRRHEDRNSFVRALFDYEEQVKHNASMRIDEDMVEVTVVTKDIEQITELDKEYAAYCDEVFKDLVHMPDKIVD